MFSYSYTAADEAKCIEKINSVQNTTFKKNTISINFTRIRTCSNSRIVSTPSRYGLIIV